jgi:hypothetical protein
VVVYDEEGRQAEVQVDDWRVVLSINGDGRGNGPKIRAGTRGDIEFWTQ